MAVRLLFDENLAPRLVRDVAEVFPGSMHVEDLELASADDEAVWMRSAAEDLMIVTKDDDFRQRSFLRGPPPKVLWLRLGNCSTLEVATVLRQRVRDIEEFAADAHAALMVLTSRE